MRFQGIRRIFSTENDQQYDTIGAFWQELSARYGVNRLMGLGCGWTETTIEYVLALKEGVIDGADFDAELPDEWTIVTGETAKLAELYREIYRSGPLLYEIEEFEEDGTCRIRYCRKP